MDQARAKQIVASIPHWHHTFEIFPGVMTPGSYSPEMLFAKLRLPLDMKGMRILDIGTSDGYFALQMRRRGAEVVCVDYRDKAVHGFSAMEQITGLHFEYIKANIYSMPLSSMGKFDAVLCLGVIYHLPDMGAPSISCGN